MTQHDQYRHTVVPPHQHHAMELPSTATVHLHQRPNYFSQVLAALAMSIGPFAAGMGKGYSSPAIASLQQRDSANFTVTGQQASWVASLSLLGALFGGLAGGAAMRFGRRRLLLIISAPLSVSWVATVFAISVEVICITSFVGGFCVAIVQMVTQVYVSEISVPAIRGGLSALLKISGHIGVLVSFAAGAWLNWRQLAALVAAGPVALCVAVACVPETPSFLVLCGRDQEAERALRWLRGNQADVLLELATIKAGVRLCKERVTSDYKVCRLLVELREPVLVTCGLMFFQRFSGANAFNFYVVSVFRQTFGGMNPHGAAVAVALVQLLSTLLSGLLVDTAGRLPLLIASSVLMSLALAAFGSYAYYEDIHRHTLTGQLDWVPLLCVLVFTVAYSLGISPISWLLIAELFPLEHRGLGTAMATSFSYLCAFVGVKTFVDFQDLFGLHGAFWLYAALSVGGLCFIVCLVPETKGQNLTEMDPKHLNPPVNPPMMTNSMTSNYNCGYYQNHMTSNNNPSSNYNCGYYQNHATATVVIR